MKELALLFLKLGTISFGGPAAHIALMEEEIVKRRGWMSHEDFLDLLGATNLIPGPNSTEMAAHIGYVRGGWKGLVVSGACFILPAASISLLLAVLYSTYGSLPRAASFIFGIRASVIAVILASVVRLSKPRLKDHFTILLGLTVTALSMLGVDEIVLLLGAGILGIAWSQRNRLRRIPAAALFAVPMIAPAALSSVHGSASTDPMTLTGIALFFLKIGSVLYGSGYVLVAFLQGGLVETRHWLTQTQLLDAIAAGQFSPGPVLSTATFIGYVLSGVPGAIAATVSIFLPSFVFVLISSPFIPRLRKSPVMRGFLDGVNAASLGLMLGVTILLAGSSITTVPSVVIFLAAVIVLLARNVNAAWIVAGGAVLGGLLTALPL